MVSSARPGSERSVIAASAETLLLRTLLALVGFGASVLLSRGLGPQGRGEYYLPVIAAATMVALGKLGFDQMNVYLFGSRGIAADRLSGQNGLVALVMGGLGPLTLLLAAAGLPGVFAGTSLSLLMLVGLSIPFTLHTQFSAGLLTLTGEVTWQFRAALLAGVVQLGGLAALWALGWLAVGSALALHVLNALLTWLVIVWALGQQEQSWVRWDPQLLRETVRHSALLHLGFVLFFLHLRLDMFMVKVMVGPTALGLYSLAVILAETVLLPTDSLTIAVLPRQVGNTLPEAATLALRVARANVLLALGVAVIWTAVGMGAIRIVFGAAFADAYGPLVGLLPGMVFLGMQRVCGGPALRAGKPGRITGIYALSLLCNIALNLVWIPRWGPLGASLASSVSYGAGAVMFLAWMARLAGAPLFASLVPRRSDWQVLWRASLQGTQFVQHTLATKAGAVGR